MRPTKPQLLVLCSAELFPSFFDETRVRRLGRSFRWRRLGGTRLGPPLADAEALITTWSSPGFGEDLVSRAPHLRIVAHCGGEVKRRFERGLFQRLVITNAPGPMAPHVAELAVTFLLHSARRIEDYRQLFRSGQNRIYRERHLHGGGVETLCGRRVGLVGFGRIGREVARLLRPFGPRLTAHDPHAPRHAARRHGVVLGSLRRVLESSEFLVLAAGLTDQTRGMIDAAALSRLPDGATVVNVARGGLIDIDALTREVGSGRLRCCLDVTDPVEPLPARHPLRRMPGALVTPHVGATALTVRHAMADSVLDDLEGFFAGKRPRNRVTPSMLDRMT